MTGDLAGLSLPAGVSASFFRSYLLNDSPFVVLLSIQPVIAGLGFLDRMQKSPRGNQKNGSVT